MTDGEALGATASSAEREDGGPPRRTIVEIIRSGELLKKPRWQVVLESGGGAALITVLIGGIAAQVINLTAQRAATRREFNNAWVKARGDQALNAYKDYVHEQLKIAEE